MARSPRIVEPNVPLHVVARGNYRQTVFHTDDDRRLYLHKLARLAAQNHVEILGWCLMTNHVHLLLIPQNRPGLSKLFQSLHSQFSTHINQTQKSAIQGHLWQGRFYSCPLAFARIWEALRYIELNPVRAGLVPLATDSLWSSAAFHTGHALAPGFLNTSLWSETWTTTEWKQMLSLPQDEAEAASLRDATHKGILWADHPQSQARAQATH